MINVRDKWLSTLLLVILLHVGVFFILYLNLNNNLKDHTHSKNSSDDKLTVNNIDNEYQPIKTQTYISTANKIEDTSKPDSGSIQSTDYLNKAILEATKNQVSSPKRYNESETLLSKEVDYASDKPSKENNETLKDKQASKVVPTVYSDNEYLVRTKNDGSLLNMDIPTQQTEVKIDKNHDFREAEEINNQLSAAINEVKKRNQQKIDQMQQQQPDSQNRKGVELAKINSE